MQRNIPKGERPPRPGSDVTKLGLSDEMWAVIVRCWDRDPKVRLRTLNLVEELQALAFPHGSHRKL